MTDVNPEAHKLVRLFVRQTGCLDTEYGGRMGHLLRTQTCALTLSLRNGETGRGAHGHEYDHHLSGQLRLLQNNSDIVSI